MVILIDLDGTLINTAYRKYKPYKDGLLDFNLSDIPFFKGAIEFVNTQKAKGNRVIIVSDSHPRYVSKIASGFRVESIDLMDKPNTFKMVDYIQKDSELKSLWKDKTNFIVVGDTKLDIEFGRKLEMPTVWLELYKISENDEVNRDERDGIGYPLLTEKMGPTYYAKSFADLLSIIDKPCENLYTLEAAMVGKISTKAIRFRQYKTLSGWSIVRCLARQQDGCCDKYAQATTYFKISNNNRKIESLKDMAKAVENYLVSLMTFTGWSWDYFTYVTDKATTQPLNKMKEIFDLINTPIPKVTLLKWLNNVNGSIRLLKDSQERKSFVSSYLNVDASTNIDNKNIIVLDDQLTTGATSTIVIRKLHEKGAKNILFLTLFQMIDSVMSDKVCPRCGKMMKIKIRRSDGHRFYSCVTPRYGGNGCGYIEDIPNQ